MSSCDFVCKDGNVLSLFFIRSSVKSRLQKQVADSLGRELLLRKTQRNRLLDFGSIEDKTRYCAQPKPEFYSLAILHFSNAKIRFQSFFMLITDQLFFFAWAIRASLNMPILDFGP